jgi:taurine dioxygenase
MMTTLKVQRLQADFGVEIDADLSTPLTPDEQADLFNLFNEHGLVVFRAQQGLTQNQQIRLLSYLRRGRFLERDPGFVSNLDTVGKDNFVGSTALAFHSDSAFLPSPMGAISLMAVDVPPGETSTRFCNAKLTYRRLPPALRERIEGLHTIHVMPGAVFGRNRIRNLPSHYPRTTRLLVHRHPVTAEPVLYVSWIMIDGFVELPEDQSDALLDELLTYVADADHLYEHRWRNGDLVVWDNIQILHARDELKIDKRRILQRASAGAYHFSDLFPEFPAYSHKRSYEDA